MNTLLKFECDLVKLNQFSKNLAEKTRVGDLFLLRGVLGSGKTTFARTFINALFDIHEIKKPKTIKSPSFPIMINYPLLNYEIFHYDLYRLNNKNELSEIGILEELEKNISIIEWPDIILNNFLLRKYYLLEFEIIDLKQRSIKVLHSKKFKF